MRRNESNKIFMRYENAIQISYNEKMRAHGGRGGGVSFVTVMVFHHKAETRKTKVIKMCDDQPSDHR